MLIIVVYNKTLLKKIDLLFFSLNFLFIISLNFD